MYIKDEKFVEDYLNESLKIAKNQLIYNKKIITVAKYMKKYKVVEVY